MTSQKMKGLLKKIKPYFLILLIFGFYLLTLPQFVKLSLPCLQRIPGQTFEHSECVLSAALDRFMVLSLIGFVILILILFLYIYPRSLLFIGITAFCMALGIIFSYLQYIPESERAINGASIILFDPSK